MKKYYAVKIGKKPGIYETWDQCKEQVSGFSGAQYKSFTSLQEAKEFIVPPKKVEVQQDGLIAYVDGSYNVKTKEYGYGCVCIDNQKVIKEMYGKGTHQDYVEMRNVSGEIIGCEVAVEYAIDNGYNNIYIYYDYEGIEKWATNIWKANKIGTKAYVEKMKDFQKQIQIYFIKVLAHSGDVYNDRADALAKKAVGIK
ncbi:MAG: viroplasmin family protein [Coprobacillaceae bacterium]